AALREAPSPLAADIAVDPEAVAADARAAATESHPTLTSGDPRLAWEPGRGRRLVRIAGAVRVTGSAPLRHPFEIALRDWLAAQPTGDASDPLEVALRAWNMWVAASMVGVGQLGEDTLAELAAALVGCGRFLEGHLEDRGLVVGSHLVGELVGLY